MSLGRGKILHLMKQEVCAKTEELQHQLYMAGTSDYTNESIEKFCNKLADRDESNWTCGQSSGVMPRIHSVQASTPDYTNENIGKNSFHMAGNDVYGPRLISSENSSRICDDKFSDCKPDASQFEDSETNGAKSLEIDNEHSSCAGSVKMKDSFDESYQNFDVSRPVRNQRSKHGKTREKRSYNGSWKKNNSSSPLRKPEKVTASLVIDRSQACMSKNPGESIEQSCRKSEDSTEIEKSLKPVSVEAGTSSLECVNYFDDLKISEDASKLHSKNRRSKMSSRSCEGPSAHINTKLQSEPKGPLQGIGRGQRLKMVKASIPKAVLDTQSEISMNCDSSYTNQSIENYLEGLITTHSEGL